GVLVEERLEVAGVLLRLRQRRRREVAEHLVDGLRSARRLVLERVDRPVGVAEELRLLGAQREDPRDHRGVVGIAADATRDGSLEEPLAQRATPEVAQQRLLRRVLQREEVLALQLARLRRFRRGADLFRREAFEVFHILDDHRIFLGALERVLPELRRQRRDLLVDLLEGDEGVLERRRRRVARDRLHLRQLLAHSRLERRDVVRVLDPVERRVVQRERAYR